MSDETQVQQDAADQEHGSEEMHPIDVQLPANAPDAASEAAEEKAEEVSDPRTHRFECRSCGYVYDPEEGVKKQAIPIGTAFQDIDTITFRCPVCRSKVGAFREPRYMCFTRFSESRSNSRPLVVTLMGQLYTCFTIARRSPGTSLGASPPSIRPTPAL